MPATLAPQAGFSRVLTRASGGAASSSGTTALDTQRSWLRRHECDADAVVAECAAALSLVRAAASAVVPPRTHILVTGVGGFLGRYLLVHLLQALPDHTVHVLLRGPSTAACQERVAAVLERVVGPDAAGVLLPRVVVHAGDVSQPLLGMQPADYAAMTSALCAIVHAAAAVKFYSMEQGFQLLAPHNVTACGHIARAAVSVWPPASVHYVSTSSVSGHGLDLNCPSASTDKALGEVDAYSATKLLGEVLLRRLSDAAGVHVVISRPSLLTWSAGVGPGVCRGVANAEDWLMRLVHSCLAMHLVPAVDSELSVTLSGSQKPTVLTRHRRVDGPVASVTRVTGSALMATTCTGWNVGVPFAPVDIVSHVIAASVARGCLSDWPIGCNILYPSPSSWTVTPAEVLSALHGHTGATLVPPYAWLAAVRSLPEVPFHSLASMGLVEKGTCALKLSPLAAVDSEGTESMIAHAVSLVARPSECDGGDSCCSWLWKGPMTSFLQSIAPGPSAAH